MAELRKNGGGLTYPHDGEKDCAYIDYLATRDNTIRRILSVQHGAIDSHVLSDLLEPGVATHPLCCLVLCGGCGRRTHTPQGNALENEPTGCAPRQVTST